MNLMAIDPGSKEMGVFYGSAARPFTLRVQNPKAIRAHRLADLLEQLENMLHEAARWEVDTIVYERPFARGRDATRCLWGVAGIIEAVGTNAGCAVLDVPPATLTKWALGSATKKRNKNPMIDLAATMGYGSLNEHEADALLLYHYGLEHIKIGESK